MFDNVWKIWKLINDSPHGRKTSGTQGSKQPILPDLRTITIMKSVRFSFSLFGSYYFLVLN